MNLVERQMKRIPNKSDMKYKRIWIGNEQFQLGLPDSDR